MIRKNYKKLTFPQRITPDSSLHIPNQIQSASLSNVQEMEVYYSAQAPDETLIGIG